MKKYIISTIITLMVLMGPAYVSYAGDRSFTILTAIPSPTLRVKTIILDPSVPRNAPCRDGEVGLNIYGTLYVCDRTTRDWREPATVWTQSGNNVYLTDISTNPNLRVNIGSSATAPVRLYLPLDGSFMAAGTLGSGTVSPISGAWSGLMFYARKLALRVGNADSAGQWNNANIGNYSFGVGDRPKVATHFSTITGGSGNQINPVAAALDPLQGDYSVIGGGMDNTMASSISVIGGGTQNVIIAGTSGATISGGSSNLIETAANGATIGGGAANKVDNHFGTIGGGSSNRIDDYGSTTESHATIGGGGANIIRTETTGATIGGGSNNSITGGGRYSTIAGGSTNFAGGALGTLAATVGGGTLNQASASYATIGGGESNQAIAQYSSIIGGSGNTIGNDGGGQYASILGGSNNQVLGTAGTNAVILGGDSNQANGNFSAVGGRNQIVTGNNTFVWGVSAAATTISQSNAAIFNITGNMGVGITNPTTKLDVGGSAKFAFPDINESDPHFSPLYYDWKNGTREIGYDVAELFDANEEVEIGDLVEAKYTDGVHVQKTQHPYSTRVVGVVSGAPAILFEGSELQIAPKPGEFVKGKKPPVALAGRILVKVTNENGPIEEGDLLVSSSIPGHAMKATNRNKALGATVGKAIQPFNPAKDGPPTGVILMIVNLQ